MSSFDDACSLLETTLRGDARQAILDDVSKAKDRDRALLRLRDGMRSHAFKMGASQLDLSKTVRKLDNQTRQDGFNVLHDWDGVADKSNKEIIPVDVVSYFVGKPSFGAERKVLAILLDYYFLYIIALLALRAWGEGDANQNLDRLTQIISELQGAGGSSGQKFVDNAETLILIATSHFEPDDKAYGRLLAKIRTLDPAHQTSIALVHAGILGSHLRFGFEFFYNRDIVTMRNDNGPDYPWLCFALATLMDAYVRMHEQGVHGIERDKAVEGILNALTPDARAFVGKAPASLAGHEAEHRRFSELFQKHRQDLLEEFERHRPGAPYSPLSFGFNFPHNIVKGMVVNALLWGEASDLTVNDLLTSIPKEAPISSSRIALAEALTRYARLSPEKLRGREFPSVLYDSYSGLRAFAKTMSLIPTLKKSES